MSARIPSTALPVVNIAAYKFVPLTGLAQLRNRLRALARSCELKGTVLLSPEGINVFVAGARDGVDAFMRGLFQDPRFADLSVKESFSAQQPFQRMLVRLKQEIIAFGVNEVDPAHHSSRRLSPAQLKSWLDQGRDIVLLDTRNDYEVALGSFQGAAHLSIGHFRDFPQAAKELPQAWKERPIVMYCTGGIRCEKAGPFLELQGFREVYQLEGGVLKYFETCGGAHWRGECFVFDQRVALGPDLLETPTTCCFVCQAVVSIAEQQSPYYQPGQSCPFCYETPEQHMKTRIASRQAQIRALVDPLPGCQPYNHERPLNVPQRFAGWSLLDFLEAYHPHVGRQHWQSVCDQGRLRDAAGPARADQIVHAGQRFVQLLPAYCEPEVRAEIRVLYEDEALVAVDKPAPLPLHPSGRFYRNTLQSILNQAFRPQKLRPAHRLDANTSGMVLFSRTRAVAARLQPQFAQRTVVKTYVARLVGHPDHDRFSVHVPVSAVTSTAGIRLPDPQGRSAKTDFEVLRRCPDGTCLVLARPVTGRTNQIRAHAWSLGMPICGDPAYLPDGRIGRQQTLPPNAPPLCLHAWRLRVTHPLTAEPLELCAPLPDWAAAAEDGRFGASVFLQG